jgi:hypothetical protein
MTSAPRTAGVLALALAVGCGPGSEANDCTTVVEGAIEADTVWGEDCTTIELREGIRVQAALTVLPGTRVVAQTQDVYGLIVEDEGSLNAVGTEGEPIVFESAEGLAGSWGGLTFLTVDTDNALEYVTIRDSGANSFQFEPYALFVGGGGVPDGLVYLNEVTFENISAKALQVLEGGSIDGSENVWFTDVEGVPATVTFDTAHHITTSFDFDPGLTQRYVQVERGDLASAVRWQGLDVPFYLATNSNGFTDTGFLTVEAGATLEFAQGTELVTSDGKMAFDGTPDDPVTLTGREPVPGYWGGLAFGSVSPDNILRNTILEYAGGDNYQGNEFALLVLGDSTSPGLVAIDGLTIRDSAGGGIRIFEGGAATGLDTVTFEAVNGVDLQDDTL